MGKFFRRLLVTIGLAGLLAGPGAAAGELTPDEVKRLAIEAIRENPGIVMEALRTLQQQQEAQRARQLREVLAAHRRSLEQDPNAPVLGNPEGDVTIVEFLDYNCPYCKRAQKDVKALLELDPGVRLVIREWPILGEGSRFAARAALAARKQGRYAAFHEALMSFPGRATEATVMKIARDTGLDVERLRADMEAPEVRAHIAQSMALADALGFNGTPSFVIGDEIVPGVITIDAMQTLVAAARKRSED